MIKEYLDIIELNLELIKHSQVKIVLVAPEIQANILVIRLLEQHLASQYVDDLKKLFDMYSVPTKKIIRQIQTSFIEIVHPHSKLENFILSNTIKYIISLKTGVPMYSIPSLGSYSHRDLFTWLGNRPFHHQMSTSVAAMLKRR
ncbi:hypothetical protein KQX54_013572 [Cotesia glomerata]|uniref:Uncharacterized protein n=1 Tax=Cotesia glomerata TaxID=32391 RepID=A0AAV7IP29_COTGL|nr:hypothetical protein KQX54_013572 [Cotesia glomerata]